MLSPLLVVMQDEVLAFACYRQLMIRLAERFDPLVSGSSNIFVD